jgi:transcriptional regulator with PAS, ATPase and Fis domain
MYYIYHIPGVKIGCTDNVERRIQQQGFIDYQILEEHIDIFRASNRELALQKEYGYNVDNIPYFKSVKQWGAKAGSIGGKNAAATQRKNNIGFHTKDKTKISKRAQLGGVALLEKYGSEHFKKMRENSNCIEKSKEACSKGIVRIDEYGNTRTYNSITEASKDMNTSVTAISNCLRGKVKTSCGYKWYYQKHK